MKKIALLFILLSALTGKQSFSQCGQISMIGEFNGWAGAGRNLRPAGEMQLNSNQ